MSAQTAAPAPRTPGAKRAGPGEHLFDLATVNHLLGGPDYSTANGAVVEGDRMIVGLMRMPAGTGAEPHSHPNEQWIYVLEGTLRGTIGEQKLEAKAGSVIYIPADAVHAMKATPEADVVFFTCKDSSYSLQGIRARRRHPSLRGARRATKQSRAHRHGAWAPGLLPPLRGVAMTRPARAK